MTIARDMNGAVVGQVTTLRLPLNVEVASRTPKMDPERFTNGNSLTLLARDGRYVTVPLSSVRLEEV